MSMYNYTISVVNPTTLSCEIHNNSVISGTLSYVTFSEPNQLDVSFNRDLYSNEVSELTTVVSGHDGSGLTVEQRYEFFNDVREYLDEDAMVADSYTSISGTFIPMQVLLHRRDLYNDEENPVYLENHTPLLGPDGSVQDLYNNVSAINTAISPQGWYTQYIKNWTYPNPQDLLIYYGWLNGFNYSKNSWSNEKVAQDMAKYNYLVFGNGLQDSGHGDYSNTQVVIPRIKALNQYAQVFGYVSVNQSLANFKTKVDQWDTLQVDGIFMDEAGYDYGTTRSGENDCIDYVHGKTYANICFINAWNIDHIIGTENDTNYPNSTYNPTLEESNLTVNDWYLLESYPINTTAYTSTGGYESKSDWAARGAKAADRRYTYGINLAAVGIINNDNTSAQSLFNFGFISAMIWNLEAFGTSDTSYGSSSATVSHWYRPNTEGLGREWAASPSVQLDLNDADKYYRYLDYGRLHLDFSTNDHSSHIEKFTPPAPFVIKFSAGGLTEGTTPSPTKTTASGNPISGLAFDDTVEESMYGVLEIPSNWSHEMDVGVKVQFFNDYSQSGTKVCRWALDYQIYDDLDNISQKTTTILSVNQSLPADANPDTFMRAYLTMSYNDTNNPIVRENTIMFRIYRDSTDAADTMENDAVLVVVSFEFPLEVV